MKNLILTCFIMCLLVFSNTQAQNTVVLNDTIASNDKDYTKQRSENDTTIIFNEKRITITDSIGQIRIEVYEQTSKNDTVTYKEVYKGIFSDEKNYEKYTLMDNLGIQLPFITKKFNKKKMEANWAGSGIGFTNISDQNLNMTTVNGLSIKPEKSIEWTLNFAEKIIPIYRNNLGLTTGLGLDWKNYNLDNNTHLVEVNGITGVYPADNGISYKKSKFRLMYLTLPLLLEWQPNCESKNNFFLSAGIIGELKLASSLKVKYKNANGDTKKDIEDRGLNASPISMDYFAQIGYDDFRIYAKYSPFSIFQSGKGPDVRAVSMGVMFDF